MTDDAQRAGAFGKRSLPDTRDAVVRPVPSVEMIGRPGDTRLCAVAHLVSFPIERVEVDETDERVIVTLYELVPAADAKGGRFVYDVGFPPSVVQLRAPLGSRPLIEGATGARHDLSSVTPHSV